ncbi:MAG: ABC transporter ATP-binding protein [Clostridium sp.]|uniref:ABC transporter ATP-binding protein n=1 Tax=Clostridium sp. TaxID=1506 RepID=UPI00290BF294|nr:ABC transporter ATP-binding protein [Clostridium sp.]MDU5111916.1 ABC transporter ATP-binding protein [Clostridium sp.]
MPYIIKCEDVNKNYKNFSLKSISFNIESGYLTGLIGINGSGKTTLINILAGIDDDFTGKVLVNNIDIKENPAKAKEEIGLVSEKLTFFLDKTPYENGLLLGEYFKNWDMNSFYLWLDKMNLPKGQPLYQFSKGMKMKFQICFAMGHSPKFLLLDEPTAGFDPVFRKDFINMLQDILNEDIGILMSTHITSDLDKIADYIILLDNGEIMINDTKEALEDEFRRNKIERSLNKKFTISDLL